MTLPKKNPYLSFCSLLYANGKDLTVGTDVNDPFGVLTLIWGGQTIKLNVLELFKKPEPTLANGKRYLELK